jgi:DNA invertase Pin-like site-specific DNA recombinase
MATRLRRKFDVLLFGALDRLSREGIVKTIGYLEQLAGWGVGWRSYTQPFLDTGNEMTVGIVLAVLAAVTKQERITISARTKAGLQRIRKAGVRLGRRGQPRTSAAPLCGAGASRSPDEHASRPGHSVALFQKCVRDLNA